MPKPLTVRSEVLPGLHRDPISAGREHSWGAQSNHKIGRTAGVGTQGRARHQRSREAAAILIEIHVERSSRATSIFAHHVHFSDIPSLTCGNDEIVSCRIIIL